MKKIWKWVRDHLPRWLDISEPTPWYPPEKDKPSKYPLLLALNKISLKPSKNIWYVGDNEIDVEFAKNNKCSSIFIENKMFKKKDLKQKPDLILKKIEALELYIK